MNRRKFLSFLGVGGGATAAAAAGVEASETRKPPPKRWVGYGTLALVNHETGAHVYMAVGEDNQLWIRNDIVEDWKRLKVE